MTRLNKTETDALRVAALDLIRSFGRYEDRLAVIRKAAGIAGDRGRQGRNNQKERI